jgi:hypothetical protein
MIDDPVFKDHCKDYNSWADAWACDCKEDDKTEWCYCDDNNSSTKMQPVVDLACPLMERLYDILIIIALSIIMIQLRNFIEQSMLI